MISVEFKQEAQSGESSLGRWPTMVGTVPGVSEIAWELTGPKPNSKLFLLCICSEELLRGTHNRISTFGVWDLPFICPALHSLQNAYTYGNFFFTKTCSILSNLCIFKQYLGAISEFFFPKCIARKCQNH